jgi:antitoxin MazE
MHIESEIKKWGNSLALRITGAMADRHHFEEGCKVLVDVTDEGLLIKPAKRNSGIKMPFSEDDLLDGLSAHQAHADELAEPFQDELGD